MQLLKQCDDFILFVIYGILYDSHSLIYQ